MPTSSKTKYEILTDELVAEIAALPAEEQANVLILGEHPDFTGQWVVDCLDPSFFFDFEESIGPYRTVSPAGLGEFLSLARSLGYRVVFENDPQTILAAYDRLNDPPPFELQSVADGTQYGFYPWQLQGFNYLKDISGKAIWSTGTGKTALAAALVKYHLGRTANLVFVLAKAHNKINTQRKLKALGDIDAIVLDTPPPKKDTAAWEQREVMYIDLFNRLEAGENLVLITNYERFRNDEEALKLLMTGRDVLCIWDEMPTRLSNRNTKLYQAVLRCIWRTKDDKPDGIPNPLKSKLRVKSYRAYELTATPIEKDPEGDFNCTRLVDPHVLGSVSDFKRDYAASFDFFDPDKIATWKNLDKFALKQKHITHIVNKKDPDIAKYFPKLRVEEMVIDWDPRHRLVYDALAGKAKEALTLDFGESNVLSLIGVLQMMCNAPSMINLSAERRAQYEAELEAFVEEGGREPNPRGSGIAVQLVEAIGKLNDNGHTKLLTVKDIIKEKHGNERGTLYTTYGPMLLPILSAHLDSWGVSHVIYAGTQKQRQEALDRFRSDDSIQMWVSSDSGSDSIDLEMCSFGIDYDLPWKATTRRQRHNRLNRAGATFHNSQVIYTPMMANSVEDRKLEINLKKQGYHDTIYEGKVAEESFSSRMTTEDLLYILTGLID